MIATTAPTREHTASGLDKRKLLMWTFLASDCVFLAGQFYEFTTFVTFDGLTLDCNLFDSTFFTLAGLHGTHVAMHAQFARCRQGQW